MAVLKIQISRTYHLSDIALHSGERGGSEGPGVIIAAMSFHELRRGDLDYTLTKGSPHSRYLCGNCGMTKTCADCKSHRRVRLADPHHAPALVGKHLLDSTPMFERSIAADLSISPVKAITPHSVRGQNPAHPSSSHSNAVGSDSFIATMDLHDDDNNNNDNDNGMEFHEKNNIGIIKEMNDAQPMTPHSRRQHLSSTARSPTAPETSMTATAIRGGNSGVVSRPDGSVVLSLTEAESLVEYQRSTGGSGSTVASRMRQSYTDRSSFRSRSFHRSLHPKP
jgi:hypothetical protein